MQLHARPFTLTLALAILLSGMLIPATGFARGVAGGPPRIAPIKGGTKPGETVTLAVKPRILEFKPIPASHLPRLNKDAHAKYDAAIKYIDKINYEKSVECFQQAIQAQPDDVYLRHTLIQVTQYLGDTRTGPDSIKYYDTTIENLQAMVASPTLNAREKQRAQSALETVVGLRQAIGERETKRHTAGLEIAKQYAEEAFKATDADEREREKKKEAVENYVKEVNTAPGSSSKIGTLQSMPRAGGFGPTAGFSNQPRP